MTLEGAFAKGTGVMIGVGIFALLGQVAELSGTLFLYIFIIGVRISSFYVYRSAGGIAMILIKACGKTTLTAATSVLMALSMIIN